MNLSMDDLLNEIRYAERLTLRTARLYRRLQTIGTFLTVIGGSAVLAATSSLFPKWVSIAGAVCFAVFGAALVAIRPADKAASNETDAKRYTKLRADANRMTPEELRAALDAARTGDTFEIEPLRDVAYNDVVIEIGQEAHVVPLRPHQRLLAALA